MARWNKPVVQFLLQLDEQNPKLFEAILREIKRLERRPNLGEAIGPTRYTHYDENRRFRISYNWHPDDPEGEIEVVIIRLL